MISEILAIIKRPVLILQYLRREKNLECLLNIEERALKTYLSEADCLTKIMLKAASAVNSETGTMCSKLRGAVVYVCVRALKPSVMVETGVASGSSTYYILQAMEMNGKGRLYSIDLPDVDPGALIPNGRDVGWLVPLWLRRRWELILGSSEEKLPPLLYTLRTIDAFLHDSEHTYENMMFEYETAWPSLKRNGLLLSDDIRWNEAFHEFVKNKKIKRWEIFNGLGIAIK